MKANPQIKLYKYDNSAFILIAIIDDYQQISFEHSLYSAGTFTVTINYNIPNARLFERGLFVQFGDNPHDFGEILTMRNSIGPDGKGSEILNITGYDARYLFKRRIIRNLNSNDVWAMTAKGEICLRSLVRSECGDGAETKRRLPISNVIPDPASAKGGVYSVSESYTNLYDALCTIATQSEIGWAVAFENGALTLEVFEGRDLKDSVFFSTDFESLANGEYTDTAESFANVLYIGGKGEGSEQDMYEGSVTDEGGNEPAALDRFEAYDSQSSMTTEEEYEAEADAMLSQYSQNVTVSGAGLVKSPFVFRENYDVGDVITLRFSDKTAVTQILSVTEQWSNGSYTLSFSFGKPQNSLAQQISLLLKKISNASKKTKAIECVKWYTIPTDTAQSEADVTFDTLGFTGVMTANKTFTFYLDNEKTGAKSYNIYAKNLSGNYTLTLTTGVSGAANFEIKGGSNIVARILVDENGNIVSQSMTATDLVESGNNQPATSNAVFNAIDKMNYLASARNIDTLYPSENGKSEVFGGNFSGNVPEPMATAILKTFRLSSVNSSEVQIYQEWEACGSTASGYSPNKYFRFGYFTGSDSPTWSEWQRIIRDMDVTNNISDGNPAPISSGAIFALQYGLFHDSGLLKLWDYQESTVTLNESQMYLYINIHATYGQELVILNCYNGALRQTRITHGFNGVDTVITNNGQNVTFKATGPCRGYLLLLTNFSTT